MSQNDLVKDTIEFTEMVFRLRANTKQKWEYVGNWAKNMAFKYPYLALEYNEQRDEARKQWLKLDKQEKEAIHE